MPSTPHLRKLPRSTLAFALALAVLFAAMMAVKLALWRADVLCNDWVLYLTSFWHTNFRDLWMASFDHQVQRGYPTYINEHFSPILLVFGPVFHLLPHPEVVLLLVMGAAPIVAALFMRATALHLTGDRGLAEMLALTYALCPGLLWPTISMIYGFQPDGLLAPFAAAAAWALAANRVGAFFLALCLALCVKENVPAYGAILGFWLVIFTDKRKQGLATIVLSLAVFVFAAKGVPAITGAENRNVGTVWIFLDGLMHGHFSMDYTVGQIVVGLAYSSVFWPALFVWPYLSVIGPDLLLIGQVPQATTTSWHIILPVTVLGAASAFGTARILTTRFWPKRLDDLAPRPVLMRRYWAAALAVSLIAAPATLAFGYQRYMALASPVDRAAIDEAQKIVPLYAGVATTADLEQYFYKHRFLTSNIETMQKAGAQFSYFVVNTRSLTPARVDGPLAASTARDRCIIDAAKKLAKNGGQVLLDRNGILVVRFATMPAFECR